MTGSSPRRWWALAAIVLSVLTIGFDATILNVALPTLAADIHATNSQLQWMVDAYVLVFAGLLLPAGALADRYGRKRLMLIGLVVSFGIPLMATRLASLRFAGFPLPFYFGAQGAILVFVVLIVVYIVLMQFADARLQRALAALVVVKPEP